jgi:2'-5' RNA ligase
MDVRNGQGERINSFALVSYIDDPLAAFLDGLRRELDPTYIARAHLTVLPPRPLAGSYQEAWQSITHRLHDFAPIAVELNGVDVFPVSQAIYLSLSAGAQELERMHRALNTGILQFDEPFTYHPHVTLAQDLDPSAVHSSFELAARRWQNADVPRKFVVDKLTFVQNTLENRWLDLAALELGRHHFVS